MAGVTAPSYNGATPGVIDFDPVKYAVISAFSAVAWFNVIEINTQVFLTFKRHRGLYFWSLLITSWGIAIHVLSFILKFFVPKASWVLCATLTTLGWYPMVTGQSIVLYSRLHLVVRDPRILRFVLIMIIADIFLFHIPTTVMTFGSNSPSSPAWIPKFNIMERLQMTAFMLQEVVISGIYVWATLKLLKPIFHERTRKVMRHLIWINCIIIGMDIILLVMEYTNNYDIQASLKPMVYSIKLKLEFAVLNQLMVLANSGLTDGARAGQYQGGHDANGRFYEKKRHGSPSTERKQRTPALNRHNCIIKTQDVSVQSEKARHAPDLFHHGVAPPTEKRFQSSTPRGDDPARGRRSYQKSTYAEHIEAPTPRKRSVSRSNDDTATEPDPYGIGSVSATAFRAIANLEERERRAAMRASGAPPVRIPIIRSRSSEQAAPQNNSSNAQSLDFSRTQQPPSQPTSDPRLSPVVHPGPNTFRPSISMSGDTERWGKTLTSTSSQSHLPLHPSNPSAPETSETYTARAWRGSIAAPQPTHSPSGRSPPYNQVGASDTAPRAGEVWHQPPPIPREQTIPGVDWRRPSVNDFGMGDDDNGQEEEMYPRLKRGLEGERGV